jgi:hypothetical protein
VGVCQSKPTKLICRSDYRKQGPQFNSQLRWEINLGPYFPVTPCVSEGRGYHMFRSSSCLHLQSRSSRLNTAHNVLHRCTSHKCRCGLRLVLCGVGSRKGERRGARPSPGGQEGGPRARPRGRCSKGRGSSSLHRIRLLQLERSRLCAGKGRAVGHQLLHRREAALGSVASRSAKGGRWWQIRLAAARGGELRHTEVLPPPQEQRHGCVLFFRERVHPAYIESI